MGTISVTERPDSREKVLAQPGEPSRLILRFDVLWTPAEGESSEDYPGDQAMDTASGLPAVRDRWLLGTDAWENNLVCRSVAGKFKPETMFERVVEASFSTLVPPSGAYFRFHTSPLTRSLGLFRKGWSEEIPEDGVCDFPPTTDIGGTKVDSWGNPRQLVVPQRQLVIEVLRNRTTDTLFPFLDDWVGYEYKRNSEYFMGAAPGTLLYVGASTAPTDELFIVQHTFIWDKFLHCRQEAVKNPAGGVRLVAGATMFSTPQMQAEKVYWYQEYPDLADFSDFFTADELIEMSSPIPEWPT